MDYSYLLHPFLGERRTLIIACHDCDLFDLDARTEHIFIHTCPCTLLNLEDSGEVNLIRHYIEDLDIEQIITIGHTDCRAIRDTMNNDTSDPSLHYLHKVVSAAWNYAACTVWHDIRLRVVAEQNVIRQVGALSQLPFVEERLNSKTLIVRGLAWKDSSMNFTEICRNTIVFDDIVSSG